MQWTRGEGVSVGTRKRSPEEEAEQKQTVVYTSLVFFKFNLVFFHIFLTSASVSISSLPNHSGSYMSARQSCSRRDASCMAGRHVHRQTNSCHQQQLNQQCCLHCTHFSLPPGRPSGLCAAWCPPSETTQP